MKKLCFLAALLWAAVSSYAQQLGGNDFNAPTITPQAPEVASLLKFSETPVSYHTGVPNISVPIASLSGRELSASVSISYHAGGHRVSEESSWVGLGWNLSAGGQITRTVRGKPDDLPNGYILTQYTLDYAMSECSANNGAGTQLCADITSTSDGALGTQIDYEPDEFSFSAMGQSARFMFDQRRTPSNPKGGIILFEGRGMQVVPTFDTSGTTTDGKILEWDITDTAGNIYHFEIGNIFVGNDSFQKKDGAIELCESCGNGESYTETWDLKTITSPNGDVLTFQYNTPTIPNASTWNDYSCTLGTESFVFYSKTDAGAQATYPNELISNYTITKRKYTELSKIISSQGSIEFIKSSSNRDDTQSEKQALKYIRVRDKKNKLINEVELVQGYFTSSPAGTEFIGTGYTTSGVNTFLNRRLYLQEVRVNEVVNGVATSDFYHYGFTYNTGVMLPHKRSFSRDHWGYYNGASNTTLIPHGINSQAANREVNPEYSSACILKKIEFPEGGTTEFFFENNRGETTIQRPAYLEKTVEVKALTTEPYTISQNGANTTYQFTKEFTISEDAKPSNITATKSYLEYAGLTNRCENVDALYDGEDLVCDNMFFNLYKLDSGGNVDPSFSFSVPIWQFGTIEVDNNTTYRAEIIITGTSTQYNLDDYYSEVVLKWLDKNPNPPSDYPNFDYFGGLRVQAIKTYDNHELASYKSYNYYDGYILSMPTYVSQTGYQTKQIVSESWVPLLNTQAKYQGYGTVIEAFHNTDEPTYGKGALAKTITRTYLTPSGTGEPVFPGAPYEPLTDRSKIKKEVILGKKQTDYDYAQYNFIGNQFMENIWGYKTSRDLPTEAFDVFTMTNLHSNYNNSVSCGQYSPCAMGNHTYQIAPSYTAPTKVITRAFEKKGITQMRDTMTTIVDTYYDRIPYHYNPTRTSTTESNGAVLKTAMEYPYELSNTALLDENKINTPLRTQYFKDNILLQTVESNYALFGSNYLIQSVKAIKSQTALQIVPTTEERVVYHGYYSNGNIQEVSKKDGTHIVYIWGYDQTVPVAKIENATYNDIPTTVYDDIIAESNMDMTSGTTLSEDNLRAALNSLRTSSSLTKAMITTYTYDPLIGVTSITDPRGNTIYYEYDGYGRLSLVKDKDGNILSENNYHYKN